MDLVADLHTHTTFSDGIFTPAELFEKARLAGLSAISITDHDTMDGYLAGLPIAKEYGLQLVPGIELSCYEGGRDYHLLGYFTDPENKALQQNLTLFRHEREKRAERIVKKLNKSNLAVNFSDVLDKAGVAPVARPHIAAVMIEQGFSTDMKSAFEDYLSYGKPAYEPKWNFPVELGVKILNDAGGVAVLAHPGRSLPQQVLARFIQKGLDGIEVLHPSHSAETQAHYKAIVGHYCLLSTGGSDFHGSRDYDATNFGKFVVPITVIDAIQSYLHRA
jgi:predicted metal-dependent phosphoesterase TrpH